MPGPLFVPDASVLLKWALESEDEKDRDHAIGLKESWLSGVCQVLVPSLWVYEVGNILGLKRPALAIHAGGVFLTADAAYARKTSAAGHIDELKDWRLPRGRPAPPQQ